MIQDSGKIPKTVLATIFWSRQLLSIVNISDSKFHRGRPLVITQPCKHIIIHDLVEKLKSFHRTFWPFILRVDTTKES